MRAFLGVALSIAAMVTASFATGASAADRLETIKARGKILVGTGSTNPPWHFKDERPNYYLEKDGRKLSRRYYNEDLWPAPPPEESE